jgi:hypothetical protein
MKADRDSDIDNIGIFFASCAVCTSGVPRRGIWGGPPKFRSFAKAEPNSQFREIYIRNNLIRIRVSLIYKLSETPN